MTQKTALALWSRTLLLRKGGTQQHMEGWHSARKSNNKEEKVDVNINCGDKSLKDYENERIICHFSSPPLIHWLLITSTSLNELL